MRFVLPTLILCLGAAPLAAKASDNRHPFAGAYFGYVNAPNDTLWFTVSNGGRISGGVVTYFGWQDSNAVTGRVSDSGALTLEVSTRVPGHFFCDPTFGDCPKWVPYGYGLATQVSLDTNGNMVDAGTGETLFFRS